MSTWLCLESIHNLVAWFGMQINFQNFSVLRISSTFFKKIEVQLIYNTMLVLGMQQRDSVIHIYLFFLQIFFHYKLLQVTECCSLWYTLGPCFSHIYVYISPNPQLLMYSPCTFFFPLVTISLFSVSVSLFCKYMHLYYF